MGCWRSCHRCYSVNPIQESQESYVKWETLQITNQPDLLNQVRNDPIPVRTPVSQTRVAFIIPCVTRRDWLHIAPEDGGVLQQACGCHSRC
jgi:hypothetical protein